jgi:hypothetical protein
MARVCTNGVTAVYMRRGKGKQYEAAESMLIVGEWEEGELIKKIDAPEEDKAKEGKEPRMEKK